MKAFIYIRINFLIMKKSILLLFSLLITSTIFADGVDEIKFKGSYNPNPNSEDVRSAINLYAGPSAYSNSNASFSFFANYEMPLIVSNLTLGPEVGLTVGNITNNLATNIFSVTAKGTYYVDWLIPNMPEEFDVFVASSAGFYLANNTVSSKLNFSLGQYVGGRWNFQENLSVYAQVGYGNSLLAAGISFKF